MKHVLGAIARPVALAAGVAALVVGGPRVTGSHTVGSADTSSAQPTRRTQTVASSVLACPGQQEEGATGADSVTADVHVAAARASAAAVPALAGGTSAGPSTPTDPGTLGLSVATGDSSSAKEVTAPVRGGAAAILTATGSAAPAAVAGQQALIPSGDGRALSLTQCRTAGAEAWLVGGASGPSRSERIVVTNPGSTSAVVSIEVHGAGGLVQGSQRSGITIPPGGRSVTLLDALAPGEATPVVRVRAVQGRVAAVMHDRWVEGAVGRGADDVHPSALGRTVVVPGVSVKGTTRLRVHTTAPTETLVQVRTTSTKGLVLDSPVRVVRVAGSGVSEVDLSTLPAGEYSLTLQADAPIVAGVWSLRQGGGEGAGDIAWTAGTPAIGDATGLAFPKVAAPLGARVLVSAQRATSVKVTWRVGGADRTSTVTVPQDTVVPVAAPAGATAVWVAPTDPSVSTYAALLAERNDGPGPLVSTVPLAPVPVTGTQLPVRDATP